MTADLERFFAAYPEANDRRKRIQNIVPEAIAYADFENQMHNLERLLKEFAPVRRKIIEACAALPLYENVRPCDYELKLREIKQKMLDVERMVDELIKQTALDAERMVDEFHVRLGGKRPGPKRDAKIDYIIMALAWEFTDMYRVAPTAYRPADSNPSAFMEMVLLFGDCCPDAFGWRRQTQDGGPTLVAVARAIQRALERENFRSSNIGLLASYKKDTGDDTNYREFVQWFKEQSEEKKCIERRNTLVREFGVDWCPTEEEFNAFFAGRNVIKGACLAAARLSR